jgi:uncharacterized protein YceK
MKNQVFCVSLATILAGCATADTRQFAAGGDGNRRYGAQPGSPA